MAESLQPASELVSVLGSFVMCAFYARAMGEAAFRRLRALPGSALGGFRIDWHWAGMLAVFVASTALAAAAVSMFEHLLAQRPSGHAAFTAVLVSTLWPYTSDRAARLALLTFLALVAGARLLLGAAPWSLVAGVAIGLGCVFAVRRCAK